MKKILVFIITFAYLASTSGATIYIQQCMGKTIGWSILDKKTDKCDQCGMPDNASKNCCTGHIKVLKIHNDQDIPNYYANNIFLSAAILPLPFYSRKEYTIPAQVERAPFCSRPPPYVGFCILYCTFII